jgi:hypothetical protein
LIFQQFQQMEKPILLTTIQNNLKNLPKLVKILPPNRHIYSRNG